MGRAVATIATTAPAKTWGETTETVMFWLFVGGVAWVPFWNGSNELVAWGVNATLFSALACLYEISLVIRGVSHPIGIRSIWMPAALLGLVVIWIYLQTIPWANPWLTHPIWTMAADALEQPLEGSISVNPDLTSLALLRLITAAVVFWIALQLCRNSSRAQLLIYCVSAIGAAYAAYGLITLSVPAARLPWLGDAVSAGMVSSSLINRNSYAAYAGMGLISITGLIIQLYRNEISKNAIHWRLALVYSMQTAARGGALLLGEMFVVSAALVLTGSRGGVTAATLGLFVLVILNSKGLKPSGLAATIIFGSVIAGTLVSVFGDSLVDGLVVRGITDVNRKSVYLIVVRSILDIPVLGYGYGTFEDVFPLYRDRSVSAYGIWEQAHNTYLEIFQGLGLVFGSMLLAIGCLLVSLCIRGAITRRENAIIPGIAAATAVGVGVHSVVDFSLQIQAVTLTLMAILGAGVAQAKSSRLALQD